MLGNLPTACVDQTMTHSSRIVPPGYRRKVVEYRPQMHWSIAYSAWAFLLSGLLAALTVAGLWPRIVWVGCGVSLLASLVFAVRAVYLARTEAPQTVEVETYRSSWLPVRWSR